MESFEEEAISLKEIACSRNKPSGLKKASTHGEMP